jgi:hypothetical protein
VIQALQWIKNGEFVGLVFAGSADSAVICKAEHIIDGLGIAVETPEIGIASPSPALRVVL